LNCTISRRLSGSPLDRRTARPPARTRTTDLEYLTHPFHRHPDQSADHRSRERNAVVAVDPQRNAVLLERPAKAPQHAHRARRGVAVDSHHEAGRDAMDRQRIARRAVAETELTLEVHRPLLVCAFAGSIRPRRDVKIRIQTPNASRRDQARTAKNPARRARRRKRLARMRTPKTRQQLPGTPPVRRRGAINSSAIQDATRCGCDSLARLRYSRPTSLSPQSAERST
jgi:hypothetical protein